MGLNQGPAYFTRCRSSPNRRPRSHSRSYSRSSSKTPERRRSCSKSPSRSPVRCPSIRSCTRSRSASYARSRSQSPSYSRTPPQHEPYIPIWKRQVNMLPDYQRHFLRNVVLRLRGMPNLDSFFDICGVPQYVWKHTQEDSKIEPAEVAEYSAIEQAIGTWWVSNKTKPLYWIVEQLQAGFEELRIGRFFREMLQRHPQMDPSYHEIHWTCLVIARLAQDLISLHLITLQWNMLKNRCLLMKDICYISSPHSLTDQLVLTR